MWAFARGVCKRHDGLFGRAVVFKQKMECGSSYSTYTPRWLSRPFTLCYTSSAIIELRSMPLSSFSINLNILPFLFTTIAGTDV